MKRILSLLCVIALMAMSVPFSVAAAPAMTTQTLDFSAMQGYYKTQGRVELDGMALNMDTSSAGFEFYFYGQGDVKVTADVKCTYTGNMYFTVLVDGVKTRLEVNNGSNNVWRTNTLTLATGLAEGYHHIELYKQTEASSAQVTAKSVTFTGALTVTAPKDKITIEVVGDSISGGASNLATNSTTNASYPVYQDGTQTYAYLTGEALGANVRVTQTSGYGCCGGWNSQGTGLNLQHMFPYTSYWRDHTDAGYYDFDPAADIVVINLGTNDYSAAKNGRINLTDDQFKAGAKNLMTMAREKNPGAKVVWAIGMMGVVYATQLQAAVSELGGAANGYYYTTLPEGRSGGDGGHPNVAEHQAAANTLTSFLLQNCLPADYKADFVTAATLQTKLNTAKAVQDPKATLREAITLAQMELDCNTTDQYRLGLRAKALDEAMSGTVTAIDLKPVDGQYTAPQTTYNNETHFIWPSFYNADRVTLWKNGASFYWPYLHMEFDAPVNVANTPYLTLDVAATSNWNLHIAYIDKNDNRQTITVSEVMGNGTNDFTACDRTVMTADFGAYVLSKGHADANNTVTIVGVDYYAIGTDGQYLNLFTCALTDNDGEEDNDQEVTPPPASITSDTYTIQNGLISFLRAGLTVDTLLGNMNDADWLRVVDANDNTASGAVGTGMRVQLTDGVTVIDEITLSVVGDINGDGAANSSDVRGVLLVCADDDATLSAAQKAAVDIDGNGRITTFDARLHLLGAAA